MQSEAHAAFDGAHGKVQVLDDLRGNRPGQRRRLTAEPSGAATAPRGSAGHDGDTATRPRKTVTTRGAAGGLGCSPRAGSAQTVQAADELADIGELLMIATCLGRRLLVEELKLVLGGPERGRDAPATETQPM